VPFKNSLSNKLRFAGDNVTKGKNALSLDSWQKFEHTNR